MIPPNPEAIRLLMDNWPMNNYVAILPVYVKTEKDFLLVIVVVIESPFFAFSSLNDCLLGVPNFIPTPTRSLAHLHLFTSVI